MMACAIDYAERGLSVFPLHQPMNVGGCSCRQGRDCSHPGKHPRISGGFKQATIDPDRIAEWWTRWPQANIGLATGAWVVVIDIDPRHDGDQSLADLEREYEPLPVTVEVRTGGGGRHMYFAHPGGTIRNRSNVRPGIDVKADRGQIVLPPSLHTSGDRYQWVRHIDNEELAELPAWLCELVIDRRAAA